MARAPGPRGRSGAVPPGADALLALPPDRFTAERDALAAGLVERGDRAGAAEVKRLRRPVGLAWILNRLARARPDDVAALLDAGDRLRTGQRRAIAGEGAEPLREAEEAVRAAARTLRTAAGAVVEEVGRKADPAALARLELLLRVVAAAPGEVRDALRRGTLEREPEIAGGDLSGLAVVLGTGAAPPRAASPSPPAKRRGAGGEGRGEGGPSRAEKARAAREQREAAHVAAAARARAEREARARRKARAAAERALAKAEAEADAARARLAKAEKRVAEARTAVESTREREP